MAEPEYTWEQPPMSKPLGIISCGGRLTATEVEKMRRTWAESGSPSDVLPNGMRYTIIGEHGPEPTLPSHGRIERRRCG